MPHNEIQPLEQLNKNAKYPSGTCEVCMKHVDVMYIKDVIMGHRACLLSDYDLKQVGKNIIALRSS